MGTTDSTPQTDTVPRLTVTFTDNRSGKSAELPIVEATEGRPGFQAKGLMNQFGLYALAPGYMSLAGCKSDITFIDGDKGVLMHRGYTIQDLAEKSTFLEVAYLLRNGQLPNAQELADWEADIMNNSEISARAKEIIRWAPQYEDPMATLQMAVAACNDAVDDKNSHHMIGKMATLTAAIIAHRDGREIVKPDPTLTYPQNFLRMSFGRNDVPYIDNPVMSRAIDKIFILHADHEQNASTTTLRDVRSTQATKVLSMSAAVGALSGPRHGGANTAVLRMLENDIPNIAAIPNFLDRVERKEAQLMGFGHRVYKNMDPRAGVLKGDVDELLTQLNVSDPRLLVAKELERQALSEPYFIQRKLFPNVDFYSGIAFDAMGFKKDIFTLMFAAPRTAGWEAQLLEFDNDPDNAISRPFQVYTGEHQRPYVDMRLRAGANGAPEEAAAAAGFDRQGNVQTLG